MKLMSLQRNVLVEEIDGGSSAGFAAAMELHIVAIVGADIVG